MTDSVHEGDSGACGNSSQAAGKVAIPVKSGYAEERIVELELGSPVIEVLKVVAAEQGCRVEELVVVLDGESDPLKPAVVVDEKYPHGCRHHVHQLGEVTVSVNYQASRYSRDFKRFEAVKEVLIWAIDVFEIDASMATEFELARHDQKEELFGAEHIGHLAGKNCELELDLVRGDIANGNYS